MFSNKVFRHPIEPNKVPGKCWEETSVDLFGPLPSQNHIVVIQDLESRYPVAKFVKSTSANSVIRVLEEAYDTFGNPDRQRSDNEPRFNSREMKTFTDNKNTEQVKTPPGHPSPDNAETTMKPLGKVIKIGYSQNQGEKKTLSSFLVNCRDTPHFATGVAPAHMIFRDGYRSNLPHKSLSEKQINLARLRDKAKNINRKNVYNSSRLTKNTYFEIGDFVLAKNYKRRSKFDPCFLPEKFCVIDISANENILLIENTTIGFCLK